MGAFAKWVSPWARWVALTTQVSLQHSRSASCTLVKAQSLGARLHPR